MTSDDDKKACTLMRSISIQSPKAHATVSDTSNESFCQTNNAIICKNIFKTILQKHKTTKFVIDVEKSIDTSTIALISLHNIICTAW